MSTESWLRSDCVTLHVPEYSLGVRFDFISFFFHSVFFFFCCSFVYDQTVHSAKWNVNENNDTNNDVCKFAYWWSSFELEFVPFFLHPFQKCRWFFVSIRFCDKIYGRILHNKRNLCLELIICNRMPIALLKRFTSKTEQKIISQVLNHLFNYASQIYSGRLY